MNLKSIFEDLLYLIYPNLCVGCHGEAVNNHELFCISCETKLPITDFHLVLANEAIDRTTGGFPFSMGMSMFRFYPGGMIQEMIHEIKYKGQTSIARRLGIRYGTMLDLIPAFTDLEYIIPVPLHHHRQRTRGFNQSKFFADGLGRTMNVPVVTDLLIRVKETTSQTSKSRQDRLKSMQEAFKTTKSASTVLKGKHVLLADDVLTTGATLVSCAQALANIPEIKISFATIAIAQ